MALYLDVSPAYLREAPPPAPKPVDPVVQKQVDTVLGSNATQQQKDQAYKLVQDYVDSVGGVGSAGIEEDAIPAQAADLLRKNGIPVVASQEVIKAVDSQLPENLSQLTPQQRREAYEAAQATVDAKGGIGANGVTPDKLPLIVGQALRDKGLPTRFSQQVVDAVEKELGPEATADQRLRAYKLTQDFVNARGGIGAAGIKPDALPNEVVKLLRDNRIPTQVKTGEDAIAILDRDFDKFDVAKKGGDTDGLVSKEDIEAVAQNKDGKFTPEQQRAAQKLLDSKAYRSMLDVGDGNDDVDNKISREDVNGVRDAIASGKYYDKLLDTAAGAGERDGNIGIGDVDAALRDPSVPQDLKDALTLLIQGSEGKKNLDLKSMSHADLKAVTDLSKTAQYAALSAADKKLVADTIREGGGGAGVTAEVRKLIESPQFQNLPADRKTAELTKLAIFNSREFKALSASDQTLVRDALNNATTGVADNIRSLLKDGNFQELAGNEKTAVLSQLRNYPDSRSISNLQRLLDKEWFQDQDFGDKQRSLKLVAHLSQHNGDRAIIDNTLNRFLSPDSDYELEWESIKATPGNVTYGHADDETLTLNQDLVGANNNRVSGGDEEQVIENTTAHEVSHLVNDDDTDQTFEYLNQEYRAWYVGYQAEHGRPPTIQEAVDRWEYFLNPSGGYTDYSHGVDSGWWFGIGDKDGALDKSGEANKIFQLLSQYTGVTVNAGNYQQILADPSKWKTNASDPAPSSVFNQGDDVNN